MASSFCVTYSSGIQMQVPPRALVLCNKTGQYNFVSYDIETTNKYTYLYDGILYTYMHLLVLIPHLIAQCTVMDRLK